MNLTYSSKKKKKYQLEFGRDKEAADWLSTDNTDMFWIPSRHSPLFRALYWVQEDYEVILLPNKVLPP